MEDEDRRKNTRPSHGEAPFELSEAFYSRTDDRGVIVAGNFVFQRVSHYSWDELIGAPHKIVRHPDMPKGVFWLFWDTLKKGKPIGAYVKNRAKDGLYYWVFAVAVPCPGGYLSVRIKPTSELFETVQSEYLMRLEDEETNGTRPEESAARLVERLGDMGFGDYTQFAAHALSQEMMSRDGGLGLAQDSTLAGYVQALEKASALEAATQKLVTDFAAIRYAPINMGVIASRLEPTGGPINSLAKNYGQMSREMSEWFDYAILGQDSNFASIKTSILDSLLVEGMSRMLNHCAGQLEFERRQLGDIDLENERDFLYRLVEDFASKSADNLSKIVDESQRISAVCKKMDQMVLGLSTTRVLCCVESARLPKESESLENIIGQLKLHQDRIMKRLETILEQSAAIGDFATRLVKRKNPLRATG